MRRRISILADIDGFFANFIDGSLPTIKTIVHDLCVREDLAHRVPRVNAITHADIRSYRMEEVCELTPDEIVAWHSRVKSPGYCARIPPYDGARECVAALQEIGDVYPLTFPWPKSPHWIIEREEWMLEQLGIDPSLAIYTKQKHRVHGDVFLEDTTRYLIEWKKEHRDGVGIRMRRPYNTSEPYDGITVDNFDQLVREVRSIAELREARHHELWNNI